MKNVLKFYILNFALCRIKKNDWEILGNQEYFWHVFLPNLKANPHELLVSFFAIASDFKMKE